MSLYQGLRKNIQRSYHSIVNAFCSKILDNLPSDIVFDVPNVTGLNFESDEYEKYVARLSEFEKREREYTSQLKIMSENLEKITRERKDLASLSQHLKVENRNVRLRNHTIERRMASLDNLMREQVCNLIEEGVHPLTGEAKGCYVFVDRHGAIRASSRVARKSLGYSEQNTFQVYRDLLSQDSLLQINKSSRAIPELSVRIAEGAYVSIKDVHLTPLMASDAFLGAVVDFRALTILERARELWVESDARRRVSEILGRTFISPSKPLGQGLES